MSSYLHDDEWLFSPHDGVKPLRYKLAFVSRTGGEYLNASGVEIGERSRGRRRCVLRMASLSTNRVENWVSGSDVS